MLVCVDLPVNRISISSKPPQSEFIVHAHILSSFLPHIVQTKPAHPAGRALRRRLGSVYTLFLLPSPSWRSLVFRHVLLSSTGLIAIAHRLLIVLLLILPVWIAAHLSLMEAGEGRYAMDVAKGDVCYTRDLTHDEVSVIDVDRLE